MSTHDHSKLLEVLRGKETPKSSDFKSLIVALDNHRVLAKVFLLEGTPFVFENSPMKYVVFREQIADRFEIGSQDVCIVGSAKLGYSPSPQKFGVSFSQLSDVDVVIISEPLFYRGSRALFATLTSVGPSVSEAKSKSHADREMKVDARDWAKLKESARNFVYENFNPGLLPYDHALRTEIFDNISSTSGLFLALEPQVFVSKIRCRVFRTWKSAEDYYSNTLREAKRAFEGDEEIEADIEDVEDINPAPKVEPAATKKEKP